MNKFEQVLTELDEELDFLKDKYSEVPLQSLYNLVSSLAELLRENGLIDNNITTLFRDDTEPYDDCYRERELGEVHDTFNVVIQGSGNPITLTRQVIRSSQDDGFYLQTMVDVLSKLRSDNKMSIEQKLDRIIELLEKLVPQPVTLNSPITVKTDIDKDFLVDPEVQKDINKHLYELVHKVKRTKVTEKPKTNYSLDVNISLMDDKGNIVTKPCYRREDGSIVCEHFTQERTIVGYSLGK